MTSSMKLLLINHW